MYIMSGDKKVVWFDERFNHEILDPKLAPIYIKNYGNVRTWIEERAVDSARANSRAVKTKQGLSRNAGAYETAMKVNAATITDNFWVRDDKDTKNYNDVVFKKNDFFGLALYRDFSGLSLHPSRTPELTNIGAQEKGWRLEPDGWWLYKNEASNETVSEYITYRIGKSLGFKMAEYDIVENGRFIKTKDFTEGKVNLQHIDSIMAAHKEDGVDIPDDDYRYNYRTLKEIKQELADEYLQICVLDALCENYDRHTKNYGVLTDQVTGEILSLAPNYDNNNSLFANYGLSSKREGGLLREFLRFVSKENIEVSLPCLPEAEVRAVIEDAYTKTDHEFDKEELQTFLMTGYEKLISGCKNKF